MIDKIKKVINEKVKNLHPDIEETIIKELLINGIKSGRGILKYITEKLKLPAVGQHSKNYWKQRGWNDNEIENKRIKQNGDHSPMKVDNWLNKINKSTGIHYNKEEAEYKIKSFRKLNKEYWLEKGFNQEESLSKVNEYQKENSIKRDIKIINNPELYNSKYPTQIEYWKLKGLSTSEAKEKVSKIQDTRSLISYIKREGEEIGTIKYNNYLKEVAYTSSRRYYTDKYGEEIGNKRYSEILEKRITPMSKSSKEAFYFFLPIYRFLRKKGVSISDIYWGVGKSNEWFINFESNLFFYDFTIPSLNIIIEYNGIKFHPNPQWDEDVKENWKSLYSNINYEEKLIFDNLKRETAIKKGFEVISIYSDYNLIIKQREILEILEMKL